MPDKIILGATGRAFARNLARIRKERGISYPQMSRAVAEKHWKLPVLALRRIEEGLRRVFVDDAMALALALEVPLADLMLDPNDDQTPVLAERVGLGPAISLQMEELAEYLDQVQRLLEAMQPHRITREDLAKARVRADRQAR